MAKRGRPPKNPESEPEADDPQPAAVESPSESVRTIVGEERETAQAVEIENVLATLEGQDAEVAIKRKEPDGSWYGLERVPLGTVGTDLTEFIRVQYGGGWYLSQFFTRSEENKWRIYASRTVKIHPSVAPGFFFQRQAAEKEKPGDTAMTKLIDKIKGDSNETLLLFLRMSQEQNNLTMKMMMDSQTNMMTAMSNMFAAVKSGGGSGNAPLDMLQVLKVFKELNTSPSATTDPLKLLEFAKKLASEFKREGDDDPAWLKVLEKAITEIVPRMMRPPLAMLPAEPLPPNAAMPASPPFPASAAAPNTPLAASAPEITIVEPQPDDMKLTQFVPIKTLAKAILPKIIEAIEQNEAEPEDALEMFNNPMSPAQLTEKQYTDLVEILKTDTWARDLFGDEVKIEKHRPWFDRLRDLVLKEAEETKAGDGNP